MWMKVLLYNKGKQKYFLKVQPLLILIYLTVVKDLNCTI